MLNDIEHWNRKYTRTRGIELSPPDSVLTGLRTQFIGQGWAVDVGCGRGANTRFLAGLGYEALGIDCSTEALHQARTRLPELSTHWLAADFDRFFFPENFFQAVVIVRFLDRKLTTAIVDSLVSGGVLFHRTFNVNHLKVASSFSPRFVLSRGELLDLYDDLDVIETNDDTDNRETQSYLLARR